MKTKIDLGVSVVYFVIIGMIIGTIFICMAVSPLEEKYELNSFTDSIYYETYDGSTVIKVNNIYNFNKK